MLDTTLVAGAISAFPVPQRDQLITITFGQLQEIIAEAVKTALERFSDLEADITTLKTEIVDLRASGEAEITRVCEDIAFDRRRITAIMSRTSPDPTKKTTDHLDELARLMSEDKTQQVSIAKAARLLRLSKERMRQLKPLISRDSRFELAWDRLHGQPKRVVIRLKQYIRADDRHTKFGIGIAD